MSDSASVPASVSHQPPPGHALLARDAAGWRSWLGRAVFEAVLIVFSVLLALWVDSWRENRARLEKLAEARAALIGEVRFNRELLASNDFLPHHIRLHEVYQGMESSGRIDRVDALFETGVHAPPLRDASWRSFSASEIASDLPFSQRAALAGAYVEQANIDNLFRMLLSNLGQPTSERGNPAFMRDLIRSIDLTLTDVVYAEQRLIKSYDEALKQLSGEAGAATPR
jgi:hypothetical protein